MPNDQNTITTYSGFLGNAEKADPNRAQDDTFITAEELDRRQAEIGEKRKEAGPPLQYDDTDDSEFTILSLDHNDTAPTDCQEPNP